MKKLLYIFCFFAFTSQAAVKELFWEDLIPQGFDQPQSEVDHSGSGEVMQSVEAPVVQSLNGQQVKIPGFVVPLEGDDETLTEFLLVPYFGACIHVPPPPPNQIVYVKFEKGVAVDNLYDAVWISGTLSTQGWEGDLATVGYTLEGASVAPYDG